MANKTRLRLANRRRRTGAIGSEGFNPKGPVPPPASIFKPNPMPKLPTRTKAEAELLGSEGGGIDGSKYKNVNKNTSTSRGGNRQRNSSQPQQPVSQPVTSSINIDITPNTNVGKPAGVKAAEADKVAALATMAAQQRQKEVELRDLYSQGLMGAQSSAADIYGGRAPAIFGQAVTGAKRQYISGRSRQVQESIAERTALRRAYDEAIAQAYLNAAQQRQAAAMDRAQRAMMASQTMGF